MQSPQFEYIIVGGGVAGLSLAQALTGASLGGRGLIIEQAPGVSLNRHIGFWSKKPGALSTIIRHAWPQLEVATPEWRAVKPLGEYQYYLLHGLDYEQRVRGVVAQHGNFGYRTGRVTEVGSDESGAWVEVDGERLAANWVFDSRLDEAQLEQEAAGAGLLWQYFYGAIVRLERPVFEVLTPMWMDFRVAQTSGGVLFGHVMPFDANQALVMLVGMGSADPAAAFDGYLQQVWQIQQYEKMHVEQGRIPLTGFQPERRPSPRVIRIGSAAGLIKPSTGYGFTRIVADGKRLVHALRANDFSYLAAAGKGKYAWMDRVLLEVIRTEPERMPAIFSTMLERNPLPRVLDFLDESTTNLEILKLIGSLPKKVMLQAGWRIR